MQSDLQILRGFLEAREIENFLALIEHVATRVHGLIEFTVLTQTLLPPLLREWLSLPNIPSRSIIQLWALIRNDVILVVENDLLSTINSRLDSAWCDFAGKTEFSPEKLRLFPECIETPQRSPAQPLRSPPKIGDPAISMRRIVLRSAFVLGSVRLNDLTTAKRNLCASSQEREFLKAVRLFLPNAWAYPNVPLRNFIQIDGILPPLSNRQQHYSRTAEVDVLLCTHDEDPIVGFELDSALHDSDIARERDNLKNQLFALAGIPLLRIRSDDTSNVRAEDFYDLLMAEKETLDKLRPSRLRPRRNHDSLVPSEF
jgi:hypothetical protein